MEALGLVRRKTVMPIKFAEAGPRSFNAMLVPHLSDEARKAVNEAFDAISMRYIAVCQRIGAF
jgi:hypothetical protein